MNLRKLACKNIGHVVKFRDSGYEVCERCGSHAGYNEEEWHLDWYSPLFRRIVKIMKLPIRFKNWQKQRQYRKFLRDNDLPF